MSGITTCLTTSKCNLPAPSRQGKWFLIFLLGLIFSFPSEVVGQTNDPPTYSWLKQQQLPTVNVTFSGVNTEDITIAVATDPEGNVYTLTFGKGIAKRNSEGVVINANFIPANKLAGPLDMAIDSDGFIYVANYLPEGNTFADNGQIRVFNPQGSLVRTILTSFYRPMGLVVDEEKVYVAEFYDGVKGPEPGNVYSRIRIYNKTTGDILDTNNQVEVPLRIAFDSQKRVYVSQAGYNNNPKLQFFDTDLNFITSIAGVTTPGSIVIDKYDYIHVVDYAGRIDFSRFINFENIEFSEIQAIAKAIDDGQKASAFSIKIFNPNRALITTLKNQIDFPLDLTFNDCDRMYVNNAKVFGSNIPFFGYLPEKIEFHLEIFRRAPSFDQEKPILTCPASIEETAPAGQNSVAVNFTNPTVTDNCSFTVTRTKGDPSGSQFTVGTHTIEFTATDAAGNFATCSLTITVNPAEEEPDTEDPVISCPSNITRNIDPATCGAVVNYTTPTATDNSGNPTVTRKEGIASGGNFPVGVTTVTYEAVDAAGNRNECSFTVTVLDHEKPTTTCPADITVTAPTGSNSVEVNYDTPSVNDRCSTTTITQAGPASGSQFAIGEHIINFTVTDAAGNFATCSLTITVNPAEEEPDTEDPVISCPSNITRNIDPSTCGAVVTYTTPTATDNSGNPTVTRKEGIASGGNFPVGVTTVTYEAVDAAGNKDECSFTVTVKDNEKPTITCPADITVTAPTGSNSVEVNYNTPSVNDRCSTTTITQTGPASGSQFAIGEHIINFTVTDAAGNFATCSLTITVNPAEEEPDTEDPVISCPSNITRNIDPSTCGAVVTYTTPTATDNSGNPTVTRKEGIASGGNFPVGVTTVTYEAVDAAGNRAECSFTVTVKDNEKPTISCPADINVTAPTGSNSVEVNYDTPSVNDRCSSTTITQTGPASESQFAVGEHIINFTVTDAAGNFATCSLTITVNPAEEEPDTEDPVISCPSNITRNIDPATCGAVVTYTTPTATDNSGNPTVTRKEGIASGGTFPVGITTVTYEAVDAAGNRDECSFTVTVKDNEKPTISCPGDITVTAPPGQYTAMVNYIPPAVTDSCDTPTLVRNQGFSPGAQFPLGSTAVTYTATDTAGNSVTCSFTVMVEPGETEGGPAIFNNCPATITHSVSTYTCGANVAFQIPTASDDSGDLEVVRVSGPGPGDFFEVGTTIVTFEATGSDGNNVQCDFTIIVIDNENPVFYSCPSDITLTAPVGQTSAAVIYSAPTARDNCGEPTITTSGPVSGSQFPVGTTTVTFIATDASGGTATCSFKITVEPNDHPLEITCPQPQSRSKNENCEAVVPDFTGEVTANKDATFSQSPPAGSIISEATTITITANAGTVSKQCNFLLTITDNSPPSLNCLEDQVENFDPAVGYTLPDYTDLINASDNCGIETIQQEPAPGTVIFEDQLVILYVWDTSNMMSNCSFTVNLTEEEVLEITCPGSQEAALGDNCSFEVPDYRNNAGVNSQDAQIVQQPAPGTIITESTNITLTATLGEETDFCSFELTLMDNQDPQFTCVADQNITFDAEEGFVLPDYREEANPSDNCTFEWVQTPVPGTIINHNQIVELVATDVSGNRSWCTFTVWLTEEEPEELQITCPEAQTGGLDANCGYLVPDFRSLATVNLPGAVVTQDPPAGTTINSSTGISLIATSGNQTVNCNFQLTLEDVTAPTVVCPPDQWENYDPATDFPLPDYRDLAVTSDACGIAQIQQSPSPGTNINQNTTVSLSVTDLSGNSITCAFTVNLTQDEVVEITCPGNQEVQPAENCSFTLADYTNVAGVNLEGAQVTQAPAPGTQITGNTTVILTATLNGKSDSCAFDVVSVDNTAPVAECILTGGYRLNQNGTLTLDPAQIDNGSSDNCGIVNMEISRSIFTTADIGDHNITLTVTDAAGNSDSCQTSISIWPYIDTGNDFACKTSVVLELDETGNAVLTPQDLYTGDPQGRIFNISKTNFSCSNLGNNYINFTYQGSIDSGTCEIKVDVQDNLAPIVRTHNITVFLNEAGRAEITPAAINSGTTDNCGAINYSLDITSFSCKDIGENQVRLTAVDASGNSSSATAMVTVTGTCDEEPPPPGGNGPDDIFIYPNPTPGPFTIATPSGQKITRVEIFDFRGRFLLSKDFAEDVTTYTLDISGVEQAVYVLNIQTSDGRRIRRVIKY